ncbi:pilus assembly protein N-terminal domain-containing protein [Manganibacter manganicus]|uniref:Pilus formation protein N-terminal domain-containing protein n=1 Tax=Manganibacter manganicus TaxID=1873176 RepID=A0A1V8RP36_9HYPH|nr:pilus assembly protein N-terminal domain-containing protein [Pseudaminobacter manganicus]OQM74955.1 hypothetical protein BFN67_03950 [Pseudaminobacter manganicus]
MAASRLFLPAVGMFCIMAATIPAHAGAGIEVVMNEAKIIRLTHPADTVVIGNPAIADATVQDASTVVLTGKGFGVTNFVALDEAGRPIIDEQITVVRQNASTVRIYRRSEVQTMSCSPYCESAYKNTAEKSSEAEMNAR